MYIGVITYVGLISICTDKEKLIVLKTNMLLVLWYSESL